MPYIVKDRREIIASGFVVPHTAGELNYALTMVCLSYLKEMGLGYQTCNDIVGALDNCKDEFRRRVQHPYENDKIAQNGDINGFAP